MDIRLQNFPVPELTNHLIGVAIDVHKFLGPGFLEIVYKDALELELFHRRINFEREKEFIIYYKEKILKHRYFADFVILDQVILEVKAKSGFSEEDYAQTINYLKCSGCKVGLILNFGLSKLGIKRVVY